VEILRFLALDVGPYFGVFLTLVLVIYFQWRIITEILDLKHEVKNGTTKDNKPRD